MGVKFVMNDEQVVELKKRINKHMQKPGPLMPTLHDAQEIFGCVPIVVQKIISEELNESIAKINGVVTFYSHFSVEPKGKNVIGVCLGTACYVRGAQEIIDAMSDVLNIKAGETSEDGLFTLEATRCIGACGLAPVFTINGEVFGSASPTSAKTALKKYIK
jgi:NADH:ubiquinone oxidoreductase subunit E